MPKGDRPGSGPQKLTLNEYLGKRGLSSPMSDYMTDKGRSNPLLRTARGESAFQAEAKRAADDYQAQRAAAIKEYNKLVEGGSIVQPTSLERRIKTAQGHSDNPAVQAARRRLEKQGIDWRTGKKRRSTWMED